MSNQEEKKSQENDPQTLLKSQENVFQKLSEMFSQSSHSTSIGDLEETLPQAADSKNYINEPSLEELHFGSAYDLRDRTTMKRSKRKQTQIPVPPVSRKSKSSSEGGPSSSSNSFTGSYKFPNVDNKENVEVEDFSQESVSMLQECYLKAATNDFPELMETCTDSEPEIINIYSDGDVEDFGPEKAGEKKSTWRREAISVDNSTQTDLVFFPNELITTREKEIEKQAQFINSVVRLKAVLSSKATVSNETIWSILRRSLRTDEKEPSCHVEVDVKNHCQTMPKETVDYVLRSSHVEIVFRETVNVLLHHLEDTLNEDFLKTANSWKNSVYERAVEMLNEAVETEVGIWKMVDSFVYKAIGSIVNDGEKVKNLILESKTNFIISFCRATHLSYTAVTRTIEELKCLKRITRRGESSPREKLLWTYQIKNSYFLFRILESSLELLKGRIIDGKIGNVLTKKPETKNYNVLEMWKKHWTRSEVVEEENPRHEWEKVVSEWSDELDEILLHCVNHAPVLSLAAERCAGLSKDILNMCHPEITGELAGKNKPTDTD